MSKIYICIDGRDFEIEMDGIQPTQKEFQVVVNGERLAVRLPDSSTAKDGIEWLVVDMRPLQVLFDSSLHWIQSSDGLHHLNIRDLEVPFSTPRIANGWIKAPIPGLIKQVLVRSGESVEMGQPVLVLEAMKMENEIRSPRQGIISELHVKPGQEVGLHQLLVEIV